MLSPRQSGSRGTLTSSQRDGDASHLGQHRLRVGNVLQHLHRGHGLELAVRDREASRRSPVRNSRFGQRAPHPLLAQLGVVEVDADDAPVDALAPIAR